MKKHENPIFCKLEVIAHELWLVKQLMHILNNLIEENLDYELSHIGALSELVSKKASNVAKKADLLQIDDAWEII